MVIFTISVLTTFCLLSSAFAIFLHSVWTDSAIIFNELKIEMFVFFYRKNRSIFVCLNFIERIVINTNEHFLFNSLSGDAIVHYYCNEGKLEFTCSEIGSQVMSNGNAELWTPHANSLNLFAVAVVMVISFTHKSTHRETSWGNLILPSHFQWKSIIS